MQHLSILQEGFLFKELSKKLKQELDHMVSLGVIKIVLYTLLSG